MVYNLADPNTISQLTGQYEQEGQDMWGKKKKSFMSSLAGVPGAAQGSPMSYGLGEIEGAQGTDVMGYKRKLAETGLQQQFTKAEREAGQQWQSGESAAQRGWNTGEREATQKYNKPFQEAGLTGMYDGKNTMATNQYYNNLTTSLIPLIQSGAIDPKSLGWDGERWAPGSIGAGLGSLSGMLTGVKSDKTLSQESGATAQQVMAAIGEVPEAPKGDFYHNYSYDAGPAKGKLGAYIDKAFMAKGITKAQRDQLKGLSLNSSQEWDTAVSLLTQMIGGENPQMPIASTAPASTASGGYSPSMAYALAAQQKWMPGMPKLYPGMPGYNPLYNSMYGGY